MLRKINNQLEFKFQPSNLKITNKYFKQYESISEILDKNPKIIDLVHNDLKKSLKGKGRYGPGRDCRYASDTILRIILCQLIEGESLRGIVIRIDDSNYLRCFVRIFNGPMIDYSRLCTLRKTIRPKTWKKINWALAESAVKTKLVEGDQLRIDTTAYETNIHWPTDSSLLWDTYRVLCRLVNTAREIDPEAASERRLRPKDVKRLHSQIARRSGKKQQISRGAKQAYKPLIRLVESLLEWVPVVCNRLRSGLAENAYDFMEDLVVKSVISQMEHFRSLGIKVVDQARRRVFDDEKVSHEEKVFSIFESHTELLKRGKAGKPIEFGHMISLQQVESKFITDYGVFRKRPVDYSLINPALKNHKKLFGRNPTEFSADKSFYESMSRIEELEEEIEVVSIAKKGRRTECETARETNSLFKLGQQFRAGIEGSISFLKRSLGMGRCLNKGWNSYEATVGATVFTHNLLILAREYG